MIAGLIRSIVSQGTSSVAGAGAAMAGLSPMLEAGVSVVAIGGLVALTPTVVRIWKRTREADRENPEQAVPVESVESIFRVLEDQRYQAANDRLYDALEELEDVYSRKEIDALLEEALAEWSRNRPGGAGNPPPRQEMLKVLRSCVQECQESAYRVRFANHYRDLVSIDRHHRSRIQDIFIRLRAESPSDRQHQGAGGQEIGILHEGWTGPGRLDFRGKSPGEIQETLRSVGNVVILGEPGSGKSTLLRYLAASGSDSGLNGALLPLILPLRELARDEYEEWFVAERAAQFSAYALEHRMSNSFFFHALSEGRCLVCLDALDEVRPSARRLVADRVGKMVGSYPGNLFVATSRRAGYDDEPLDDRIFTRYAVEPMEDADITAFVNGRLGEGTKEAENVLSILDKDPEAKSLAANPLRLSIINLVHREIGDSSGALKRTDFYRTATEVLIQDRDDEGRSIQPKDFRKDILAAVAHEMHNSGDETIGKITLKRFVVRFLEEEKSVVSPTDARKQACEFVELAERRTGLLVEQPGSVRAEFGFLHSTFRDFLVAEYIDSQHFSAEPDAYWEEIKEHLEDSHWREVIFSLLGIVDEDYCTHLIEQILAAGDAAPRYEKAWSLEGHLELAAEALARQSPMAPEMQQEIIRRLEGECRGVRTMRTRNAIRALGEIRHMSQEVVPILFSIADNTQTPVDDRVYAATALSKMGHRRKAVDFLTAVVKHPGVAPDLKVIAAGALGELNEREAAKDALIEVAGSPGTDIANRIGAASVLDRLDSRHMAIAVLATIVRDPSADAFDRALAASMLVIFDERLVAMEALTSIANDLDADSRGRIMAAMTLGLRLGKRNEAVNVLMNIANESDNVEPRIFAARQLAKLGKPDEALEALAVIMEIAADVYELVMALEAIGELGERESAIDPLTTIAERAMDAEDRRLAAAALARLGEREVSIDVLAAIARDPTIDPDSRLSSAENLADFGLPEAAIEVFAAIAGDPEIHQNIRARAQIRLPN